MEDTSDSNLEVTLVSTGVKSQEKKKYQICDENVKLRRSKHSLKLVPTEEELVFRREFINKDVLKEFPLHLKCTICSENCKKSILAGDAIYPHPLLSVITCKKCSEFYGNGDFSLDEDEEDKYCRWCGEGGQIFICSKCVCGFCAKCIQRNFGKTKLKEIKEDDNWVCYLCNPKSLWKLRLICEMVKNLSANNRETEDLVSEVEPSPKRRKNDDGSESDRVASTKRKKFMESWSENMEPPQKISASPNNKYTEIQIESQSKSDSDTDSFSSEKHESPSIKRKDCPTPKSRETYSRLASLREKKINGGYKRVRRSCNKGISVGNVRKTGSRAGKGSSEGSCLNSTRDSTSNDSESEARVGHALSSPVMSPGRTDRGRNAEKLEKHVGKLKDILKVAEISSELCFKMCQKKLNKLDRSDYITTNEKLMTQCEKMKSVVILMTSSLSTVHNLIISLQQKCGNKISLDNVFHSKDESLLKVMNQILRERRVKTPHIVKIANDIMSRYPLVDTGLSKLVGGNAGGDCDPLETSEPSIALSESMGTPKKNLLKGAATDSGVPSREDSVKAKESATLNESANDSDTATDIFEFDRASSSKPDTRPEEEETVLDSSLDNKQKVYEESLALKKQLLQTSSDDSLSDDSYTASAQSGRSERRGKDDPSESKNPRDLENKEEDMDEDDELRYLMNLNTLKKKFRKKASEEKSSGEEKPRHQKVEERLEEDENQMEPSGTSDSETPPADFNVLRNHCDGINLIRENAEMLKKAMLETTASERESSSGERKNNRRKKERAENTDDQPDGTMRITGNRRRRDYWWSDKLQDSSSDLSCDQLESRWKRAVSREKKKKQYVSDSSKDEEEEDEWDECIKPQRRGRRLLISSSEEDTDIESPTKGRKNIKKILKKENLQLETRQALAMENERKKRVAERNAIYDEYFPNMMESDRLVLDFDRKSKKVLLEVPRVLARTLKPHQKMGVKFMWDCCFESLERLEENHGTGCILAHCMGLGKTLQIIALIYTLMKNNLGVNTVLILAPLNVVANWRDEFELWIGDLDFEVNIFSLENRKKHYLRYFEIKEWSQHGGVLILSYDMFRVLTSSGRRMNHPRRERRDSIQKFLLDPGPDLIVLDEGHLLKNEGTSLSQSLKRLKTSRRIILTGTPLQNNLLEYYSMIQLVKPNILGTRKEFMNRFGNPIINGQFEDSSALDVKRMRARSHVLHKLLEGCIQRFGYSVITSHLPKKHEYVISIRLTETQMKLYAYYVQKCRENTVVGGRKTDLFSDFHWLQKIWTHPKLLLDHRDRQEKEVDSESSDSVICIEPGRTDADRNENAYWEEVIEPKEYVEIGSSGKLVVLFDILKHCQKIGDKALVFSQSLSTLNLIEYFLQETNRKFGESGTNLGETWVEGIDYFRMDGTTKVELRNKWCKWFNDEKNKRSRLFLISTRAGGLGINLIGANRVILFDVSWNPSHDIQSIFRTYRFGQSKTCYVYRFFAEATMEEKVYERQVTKESLEKRVLDEHQIERRYTMGNLQALYKFNPLPRENWTIPKLPRDLLLADILQTHKDIIVTYHEHDSLLENKEEEELTEEERKAAWEDFEKERFMIENRLQRKPTDLMAVLTNEGSITQEVLRITEQWKNFQQQPRQAPREPHVPPAIRLFRGGEFPWDMGNLENENFPTQANLGSDYL